MCRMYQEGALYLSGYHVISNEDEVDTLMRINTQGALDALEVCSNVRKRGRFCPTLTIFDAAQSITHTM